MTIPKTYEINRELVLSTSHISRETNGLLAAGVINFGVCDVGYGWRILANQNTGRDELDDLLDLARFFECKWLVLDCDGDEHDDLPQFDW